MKLVLVALALNLMLVQYELNSPLEAVASRKGQVTAKHYSPGVMSRVARKRGLLDTRQDVSGYAAVPDCALIGRVVVVTLRNPMSGKWGKAERLLIVDCSHPRDYARHIQEGLGVETDYETAVRSGFAWDEKRQRGAGKTRAIILRYER